MNNCKCTENVELRICDFYHETNSSEVDNEGRRLQCQWVEVMVPVEVNRDGPQSPWGFRYPTLHTCKSFQIFKITIISDLSNNIPIKAERRLRCWGRHSTGNNKGEMIFDGPMTLISLSSLFLPRCKQCCVFLPIIDNPAYFPPVKVKYYGEVM